MLPAAALGTPDLLPAPPACSLCPQGQRPAFLTSPDGKRLLNPTRHEVALEKASVASWLLGTRRGRQAGCLVPKGGCEHPALWVRAGEKPAGRSREPACPQAVTFRGAWGAVGCRGKAGCAYSPIPAAIWMCAAATSQRAESVQWLLIISWRESKFCGMRLLPSETEDRYQVLSSWFLSVLPCTAPCPGQLIDLEHKEAAYQKSSGRQLPTQGGSTGRHPASPLSPRAASLGGQRERPRALRRAWLECPTACCPAQQPQRAVEKAPLHPQAH